MAHVTQQLKTSYRLGVMIAALLATVAVPATIASSARAMSAPIQITSTVNIRPGASTESGAPLGAIPTGASPDYQCWTESQNVGDVDVWFRIDYAGVTGYYASYWDDSSYSTDWQIVPKYGIPNCGSASAPPAPAPPAPAPSEAAPPAPAPVGTEAPSPAGGLTPAERAAINWARPYASGHSHSYSGLCLAFVFRAYSAAGLNLRPWVSVPIGSGTYPLDIWGHFSHGHTGGGTPPAGALVFFKPTNGDRTLSHIVLSIGGGNLISTSDRVASYVHYETMAQHRYAVYLGWWLPDR
jgi:hypothetical protein